MVMVMVKASWVFLEKRDLFPGQVNGRQPLGVTQYWYVCVWQFPGSCQNLASHMAGAPLVSPLCQAGRSWEGEWPPGAGEGPSSAPGSMHLCLPATFVTQACPGHSAPSSCDIPVCCQHIARGERPRSLDFPWKKDLSRIAPCLRSGVGCSFGVSQEGSCSGSRRAEPSSFLHSTSLALLCDTCPTVP